MHKMKKIKSKNSYNLGEKLSRKSIGSDNLHVPLTSSIFWKIRPSVSRSSTSKCKSVINNERGRYAMPEGVSRLRLSSGTPDVEVPENVAVHFTSFYKEQRTGLPHSGDEKPAALEKGSRNSPKMEFTRQMVYKLEHSAGTHNYGKEVSALLENTIESPGFDLKVPPADNCGPQFGESRNNFPLWYKDPSKMPLQLSRNQRYLKNESKNECRDIVGGNKGSKERKTSSSVSLTGSLSSSSDCTTDAEVELDAETECEKVGMRNSRGRYDEGIIGRAKSHLSTGDSRSSSRSGLTRTLAAVGSGPRGKRLRNSRFCYVVDSKSPISASFSGGSWSTLTSSGEREGEEKEEESGEESAGWETTEDEDASVEVKAVGDSQKIGSKSERNVSRRL